MARSLEDTLTHSLALIPVQSFFRATIPLPPRRPHAGREVLGGTIQIRTVRGYWGSFGHCPFPVQHSIRRPALVRREWVGWRDASSLHLLRSGYFTSFIALRSVGCADTDRFAFVGFMKLDHDALLRLRAVELRCSGSAKALTCSLPRAISQPSE